MPVAGRYKALRKIADGGTAEVFLAEQVGAAGFRRLVVLKKVRSTLYADPDFRRMLVEEALVAMGLHHSNLVEVLDLGEAAGQYFLVLELVDGWTLKQLLERAAAAEHPLPPSLAVYVCAELCRALSYAHNRTRGGVRLNIVHRDVCPNNVLVSETGEVKLTDFGIAKARTRSRTSAVGMVIGKPAYMSPEQASGQPLDARSDLFSAGTLLYYLLTSELPFKAPNDSKLLARVASGEFVSPAKLVPSLPKELVRVVLNAMQPVPAKRFQSAQEMLAALEKVQREVLEPAGRSELESWMQELKQKDGRVPLTRESAVSPSSPAEESEWIELSSDSLTAQPHPPPRRRSAFPRVLLGLGLCGAAGAGLWLLGPRRGAALSQPETPPAALTQPARTEPVQVQVNPPDPIVAPAAAAPSAPMELEVTGRYSPPKGEPQEKDRVSVLLETEPPGAEVKVGGRTLGSTPVSLRFKPGITFELTFEREGFGQAVRLLTLIERPGRAPRVVLQPAESHR